MEGVVFEGDLCILCNCDVTWDRIAIPRGRGRLRKPKLDAFTFLIPQLRVMYLLEKLFPNKVVGEEFDRLLKRLGDPMNWFGFCKTCEDLVTDGVRTWRELTRLQERHDRIMEQMKETLYGGLVAGGDYKEGDEGISEMDRVRRNLRKSLRPEPGKSFKLDEFMLIFVVIVIESEL